jgi:hypothetical protein
MMPFNELHVALSLRYCHIGWLRAVPPFMKAKAPTGHYLELGESQSTSLRSIFILLSEVCLSLPFDTLTVYFVHSEWSDKFLALMTQWFDSSLD